MKYDFQYRPSDLNTRARSSFVQKVYSILSIQLAVTALFVILNIYSETFAYIQYRYTVISWLMIAVTLISLLALSTFSYIQCSPPDSARPSPPTWAYWHYLLLASLTSCPAFVACILLKAFY